MDSNHLLADDSTILQVGITTTDAQNGDYFIVGFPASGGTILNADANNKIYIVNNATLLNIRVSNTAGDFYLTTQFKDNILTNQQFLIHTNIAYPDLLLVEGSAAFIDSTATTTPVTFSVYLKRTFGLVSKEVGIHATAYQIVQGDTIPAGRFNGLNPNMADASGKIAVSYFADTGDIDFSLPVTIRFFATDNENQIISTDYQLKFN